MNPGGAPETTLLDFMSVFAEGPGKRRSVPQELSAAGSDFAIATAAGLNMAGSIVFAAKPFCPKGALSTLPPPGQLGDSIPGKISLEHLRCRNRDRGLHRVLADERALIADEEKYLVFLDGSAQHTAKLVALQAVQCCLEEVARVDVGIADKFKRISVEEFVPDFITALTEAPERPEIAASWLLVVTLNS